MNWSSRLGGRLALSLCFSGLFVQPNLLQNTLFRLEFFLLGSSTFFSNRSGDKLKIGWIFVPHLVVLLFFTSFEHFFAVFATTTLFFERFLTLDFGLLGLGSLDFLAKFFSLLLSLLLSQRLDFLQIGDI